MPAGAAWGKVVMMLPDALATTRPGPPWAFRQPLAVRSALRRWRSLLGMVAGVGAALGVLLLLVGLADGVYGLMAEDWSATGVDLYVVEHGGVMVPVLPGDDPGQIRNAGHVLVQVRALPGVRGAFGVLSGQVEREVEGPRRDAVPELMSAVGVAGDAETVPDAVVMRAGRWLRRADEVVVGSTVARDRKLAVGDAITLGHRRLTVVGVGRLRGVGYGAVGSGGLVFLNAQTLRGIVGAGDVLTMLFVDADDPAAVRTRIESDVDGIDVVDRPAALAQIGQLAEHDVVIMRSIGAMALVIAAVFVGSMLQRSVAERRTEIATLRAIGVPNRAIAGLVLAEAVLVTLAALPLGLALAVLGGGWVNATYAAWLDVDDVYKPASGTVAAVLGLGVASGLLASALPLRGALRVQPADALREA